MALAIYVARGLPGGRRVLGAYILMWFHIVGWVVVPLAAATASGIDHPHPWLLFTLFATFVLLTFFSWLKLYRAHEGRAGGSGRTT